MRLSTPSMLRLLTICAVFSTCSFLLACNEADKQSLINNPATASNAEGNIPVEAAEITYTSKTYDFGTVSAGDMVTHVFKFVNNGKGPLVISKANASCGCTVPEYPRDPIMPGDSGKISVQFNTTGKLGQQSKTVTVTANTNPSNTELTLIGKVVHPSGVDPAVTPAQ